MDRKINIQERGTGMEKSTGPMAIAIAGSFSVLAVGASFLAPAPVEANIGFARDSGLSCSDCHSTPSNPTKQALTRAGGLFRSCIYTPNPGVTAEQCKNQAISDSRNATSTGNTAVYTQPGISPYPANPGYSQPVNPGYVQTPQGGYTGGALPVTPAPTRASKEKQWRS
jgi:hypothetical protein